MTNSAIEGCCGDCAACPGYLTVCNPCEGCQWLRYKEYDGCGICVNDHCEYEACN